jgi:hypothetical protein
VAHEEQCDEVLSDLSTVLWRERQLLELLVFKLEEEGLLLGADKTRWVNHASREVEIVLEQLRAMEVLRSIKLQAVASELGVESFPGLRALCTACLEPWSSIFTRHRQAFLDLTGEVRELSGRNRELLAQGRDAADRALDLLRGKGAPSGQEYAAGER